MWRSDSLAANPSGKKQRVANDHAPTEGLRSETEGALMRLRRFVTVSRTPFLAQMAVVVQPESAMVQTTKELPRAVMDFQRIETSTAMRAIQGKGVRVGLSKMGFMSSSIDPAYFGSVGAANSTRMRARQDRYAITVVDWVGRQMITCSQPHSRQCVRSCATAKHCQQISNHRSAVGRKFNRTILNSSVESPITEWPRSRT
jgi:hypothetical protein